MANRLEYIQGRPTLCGYSISCVIRWMGLCGYLPSDAKMLVQHLSIPMARGSIPCYISLGRHRKGAIADLTNAEATDMRKLIAEARVAHGCQPNKGKPYPQHPMKEEQEIMLARKRITE